MATVAIILWFIAMAAWAWCFGWDVGRQSALKAHSAEITLGKYVSGTMDTLTKQMRCIGGNNTIQRSTELRMRKGPLMTLTIKYDEGNALTGPEIETLKS